MKVTNEYKVQVCEPQFISMTVNVPGTRQMKILFSKMYYRFLSQQANRTAGNNLSVMGALWNQYKYGRKMVVLCFHGNAFSSRNRVDGVQLFFRQVIT